MSTGCCFSCSRRGIAKRVEATFSRYLLGTTPPSLESCTSAGYAYLLCRLGRSNSSLRHRRNLPFDNCPQGLKPRFMGPTDAALKGQLFHGDAPVRRCAWSLPCVQRGQNTRAATAVAARELGSRLGARTPACVHRHAAKLP